MPFHDVLRQLREDAPHRQAARSARGRYSTSHRESRNTSPISSLHQLRGDLDWITMKALEKDRSRRYGTPSELAATSKGTCTTKPFWRARHTAYRFRKYVARHRVALPSPQPGDSIGWICRRSSHAGAPHYPRARPSRPRGLAAKSVSDFLTGLFRVSDPSEAGQLDYST